MVRNSARSQGLTFRRATLDDCTQLAELNHRLIQDEGHRNRMTAAELEQRMRQWLTTGYTAILFEDAGAIVAYALFRDDSDGVYLRQLFVVRERRKQGIGKQAVEILRTRVWPTHKRLTVDVLTTNTAAIAFWRAAGFHDYCLTLEILPTIGSHPKTEGRTPA